MVFGVDEEDDAADFGEVVFPETPGWWGGGVSMVWKKREIEGEGRSV